MHSPLASATIQPPASLPSLPPRAAPTVHRARHTDGGRTCPARQVTHSNWRDAGTHYARIRHIKYPSHITFMVDSWKSASSELHGTLLASPSANFATHTFLCQHTSVLHNPDHMRVCLLLLPAALPGAGPCYKRKGGLHWRWRLHKTIQPVNVLTIGARPATPYASPVGWQQ